MRVSRPAHTIIYIYQASATNGNWSMSKAERAVYFEFKPRIYDQRLNFKVPERHMALLPVFLSIIYFNHTYLNHII